MTEGTRRHVVLGSAFDELLARTEAVYGGPGALFGASWVAEDQAGAEGLADLDRRDACARASLGSAEVGNGFFSHCQAVGCGVELGDPQDGVELCRGCLREIEADRAKLVGDHAVQAHSTKHPTASGGDRGGIPAPDEIDTGHPTAAIGSGAQCA